MSSKCDMSQMSALHLEQAMFLLNCHRFVCFSVLMKQLKHSSSEWILAGILDLSQFRAKATVEHTKHRPPYTLIIFFRLPDPTAVMLTHCNSDFWNKSEVVLNQNYSWMVLFQILVSGLFICFSRGVCGLTTSECLSVFWIVQRWTPNDWILISLSTNCTICSC